MSSLTSVLGNAAPAAPDADAQSVAAPSPKGKSVSLTSVLGGQAAAAPEKDDSYFGGMAGRYTEEVHGALQQLRQDVGAAYSPEQPGEAKNVGKLVASPRTTAADQIAGDISDTITSTFGTGPLRALTKLNHEDARAMLFALGLVAPGIGKGEATVTRKIPLTEEQTTARGAARWLGSSRAPGIGGLNTAERGREVARKAAEHAETGTRKPVLLDVLPQSAQRTVRAASIKGGRAGELINQHRLETRGSISEEAALRTQSEKPHPEASSEERVEQLERERDDLAATKYREPYAHPIQTDEQIHKMLSGPDGTILPEAATSIRDAMTDARNRAYGDPEAEAQYKQLGELREYLIEKGRYDKKIRDHETLVRQYNDRRQKWENEGLEGAPPGGNATSHPGRPPEALEIGEPPKPPTISGGALDRLRRAMGKRIGRMNKQGLDSGGIVERRNALDQYLDNVPHLKEARAEFRDYSLRIKQYEYDKNLGNMTPEAFRKYVGGLSPEQKNELIQHVMERETAKMGGGSRAMQGREDLMTTGRNLKENLTTLLGPERADKYLRSMGLIGTKMDVANFSDATVGSRTALGQHDTALAVGEEAAALALTGNKHTAMRRVVYWLFRNAKTMSEDEANQIAEWAVQQKDIKETVEEIYQAAILKHGTKEVPAHFPPKIRSILRKAGMVGAAGAALSAPRAPLQSDDAPALAGPQ